jgi:hypothetical protein
LTRPQTTATPACDESHSSQKTKAYPPCACVVGLDGSPFAYNNSASAGLINGTTVLSDLHETALFNGQLYINVHTAPTNGSGEIRGNLVNPTAIPEPSAFAAFAGLALAALRRRRA